MARQGHTFSDGGSVESGYTNMSGATGVTGRTGVTTGPGGYVRVNKLVLFWTVAMTLTVLTILSYFTMAVISIGAWGEEDDENDNNSNEAAGDDNAGGDERRFRILDNGDDAAAAADDDAAYAGDDAYQGDDGAANDAGDDAYQQGDDDAAAAQYDDQWGADNYDIGDDDQAYGVVDDAIATDDEYGFVWGRGMDEFTFILNWQEIVYLVLIMITVIALDYYGLEALKELGNKAARFRIGAFAAFVLFLGNATAACAFLLGVTKVSNRIHEVFITYMYILLI